MRAAGAGGWWAPTGRVERHAHPSAMCRGYRKWFLIRILDAFNPSCSTGSVSGNWSERRGCGERGGAGVKGEICVGTASGGSAGGESALNGRERRIERTRGSRGRMKGETEKRWREHPTDR